MDLFSFICLAIVLATAGICGLIGAIRKDMNFGAISLVAAFFGLLFIVVIRLNLM